MRAIQHNGAAAPGLGLVTPPRSDNARLQPGVEGDQETVDSPDFRCDGAAAQAALTVEGEAYARAYLQRLHDDMAQPGELAVLVSFLTGEMLHGACRLLEKALRGGRHA
jgi:hypothetical protein